MSGPGFAVDPDLLAGYGVERALAAERVATHPAPDPTAEDAFGLIGRVFAGGVAAAAASGAEALARVAAQFRYTARLLDEAAAGYRAADTAAAGVLGGAEAGR